MSDSPVADVALRTCRVCKKVMAGAKYKIIHERKHFESSLICEDCGAHFEKWKDFQNHCRIHTGLRTYHCHICHDVFETCESLSAHIDEEHDCTLHECGYCHKMFATSSSRFLHMHRMHLEGQYDCMKCDEVFKFASQLFKHMKGHENAHSTSRTLPRRRSRVEPVVEPVVEKPFACAECGKDFSKQYLLNFHRAASHSSPSNVASS